MTPNQKKILGILITLIGLFGAGYILAKATLYSPNSDLIPPENSATSSVSAGTIEGDVETAPPAEPDQSALPYRLIIPAVDINAGIQYVGIKSDGTMANPSNFTDVGWYKKGTVPGEVGSAVIAGHVDNALALNGVFKHLDEVSVGDLVYVTRKDGEKLAFKVDRLEYYPYKEAPNREIFTSSDGEAHLNLVTCAGTWIKAEHSYDKRLVVYTTLVN